MCTELFLALLYFLTIIIVNYFLYKLLLNFFSKIKYLLKIKNILSHFENSNSVLFLTLYNYANTESKYSFQFFNNISSTNDIFLIGNTYKYLLSSLQEGKTLSNITLYYFKLLENQYLSKMVGLK
jgi:hypothetical protein